MKRSKLLIDNILFFGGLKLFSSLAPLLILPFIVTLLNGAEDLGKYDMFMIIASLLSSLTLLGMNDAVFREFHSENTSSNQSEIFSSALISIFIFTLITLVICYIFGKKIDDVYSTGSQYYNLLGLILIYVLIKNISNFLVLPSRVNNRKKEIAIEAILQVTIFYFLLLFLAINAYGYLSFIYAHLLTDFVILIVFYFLNKAYFKLTKASVKVFRKLLIVGLPLVPIVFVYWLNNSYSRLLITNYYGLNYLGVFAIGSKYASISSFIQIAFSSGWSYFTFKTMNDTDQSQIKATIFEFLSLIILLIYIILQPVIPIFFNTFFEGDFRGGYLVFNPLFLAPLFLMLFQIISNQFTIISKSYISLVSLVIGTIIGMVISYISAINKLPFEIVCYGIPLGYLVSIIIATVISSKLNILKVSTRSMYNLLGIVAISIPYLLNYEFLYIINIFALIVLIAINRKLIMLVFYTVKKVL